MSASSAPRLPVAPVAPVADVRAKHLTGRTERPLRDPSTRRNPYLCAEVFDRAMNLWAKHHAGSNSALARWLGVDESLVRALRTGEKVLTLSRLAQMPADLQLLVLRLYRDTVLHGV